MLTPNCSGGRSSPPHSSHSTANAEAKRAPQPGHCDRISPPHCGQSAGSSETNSSKYRWTNPQRRQNATQSPSVLRRSSCNQFRARPTTATVVRLRRVAGDWRLTVTLPARADAKGFQLWLEANLRGGDVTREHSTLHLYADDPRAVRYVEGVVTRLCEELETPAE